MFRTSTDEAESGDRDDRDDLAERERYVVPSTGASLTYTAVGSHGRLCSLIPRDRFTPVYVPTFTGDFVATIHLPFSSPLPPEHLIYQGPIPDVSDVPVAMGVHIRDSCSRGADQWLHYAIGMPLT